MKKRWRQSKLALSLFPFLTVLICTMGVLIVMLVVAVKSADTRAKASVVEKTEELAEQLLEIKNESELHEVRSTGWLEKRNDLTAQAVNVRQRRDYLKSELDDLERRRVELVQQLDVLEQKPTSASADSTKAIEALEAQLVSLSTELAESQAKEKPAERTVYSVVPYHGPSGTRRRPIYIECLADRIVLQPYGIALKEQDFGSDLHAGNILDAALSTVRQYWQESSTSSADGDPYPLILVRSEGSGAYSLARRAMINWVDEFGYELVADDLELDYGEVDPILQKKVEAAVTLAKQQTVVQEMQRKQLAERLQVSLNSRTGNSERLGMEVDRVNGGFKLPPQLEHRKTDESFTKVITSTMTPVRDDQPQGMGAGGQQQRFGEERGSADGSLTDAQKRAGPDSASGAQDLENKTSPVGLGQNGDAANQSAGSESASTGGTSTGQAGSGEDCSLATERGRNWAIDANGPNRVGYVRPIRVFCSESALLMNPEAGGPDPRVTIALDSDLEASVLQLATEVRKRIYSWGPAPANGYWKPSLRVQVLPGGRPTFDRLKILLDQSGIELESE